MKTNFPQHLEPWTPKISSVASGVLQVTPFSCLLGMRGSFSSLNETKQFLHHCIVVIVIDISNQKVDNTDISNFVETVKYSDITNSSLIFYYR